MKILKRLISIIVVLSIISAFSLNTIAITPSLPVKKSEIKIDSSDYTLKNLPTYVLETIKSNNKEVASLDLENIQDEFAITTNNKDGTKTHYSFEVPIKYKNKNKILFRNPQIKKSNLLKSIFNKNAYESVENDIKSYFPQKLEDGILMKFKDYSIELATINTLDSSSKIEFNTHKNLIKYSNVFTLKDHIEYIPIINGLKENIVLHEYTGKNTFKFKININGLKPAFMEGESIPLLDKESNKLVMAIGQVDAKDSYIGDNPNNDVHFSIYNSLKLEKTNNKNQYILTVTVDKKFLENDTTVYPVVIDPTINITDTSRMWDTTVYSAKPNSQTFYTSAYNIVGNHGNAYGEGIPFIQVLTMHRYKHINPNKIISAYYHVREGSGKTNSSVIEIHDTYSSWEDNTITYNNKPSTYNYDSSNNVTITNSRWYDFNITGLVKAWLRTELNEGGWNQTYGFALKAQNPSSSSKHFCSANHGTYPPSVILNYNEDNSIANGVYYIKNVWTDKYLDVQDPTENGGSGLNNVIVYRFNGEKNQQWRVEKQNNGYYKLYSKWNFAQPKCLDVTGDNIDVFDNGNGEYLLFRIVSNNDGSHRIMPVNNGNIVEAVDVDANTSSGNTDYGKNVISYTYFGNTNQKWIFEKTSDVIFDKIGIVYNYAKQYKPNYNETQLQKLTLEFIRKNNRYDKPKWAAVAGAIDSGFVDFVNSKNSSLMDFFNQYSPTTHLTDGYFNEIDFHHFIITLNASLQLSSWDTGKYLAGWAGDLQSLVPEVKNKLKIENLEFNQTNIYNKTYSLLSTNTSDNFSHPDLYADIDAYNIYTCLNNMIMPSFEDYFKYYYNYSYEQRFTLFSNSWSKEQLSQLFDKYLSGVLVLGGIIPLTSSQKAGFRDAFTDYIWLRIQQE